MLDSDIKFYRFFYFHYRDLVEHLTCVVIKHKEVDIKSHIHLEKIICEKVWPFLELEMRT